MKNTKFNWLCIHCESRNINIFVGQFDAPKIYVAEFNCKNCGKLTKVSIEINTAFPKEG